MQICAPAARAVRQSMIDRDGIQLMCCGKELKIGKADGGKRLSVDSHDHHYDIVVDEILVGGGRRPNLEALGLDEAGVQYTAQGVVVDERLRTANPKIFAAGDICSRYKFTHAADAMARIVIANALFLARRKVTDLVMPWCTYTDPEIAHVGYYEKDAQGAGYDVATITQSLGDVDRAILDGEAKGFARVHYDKKSGKILGGTIVAGEAVAPTDVDMRPVLTSIATKKPCVLYFPIFIAAAAQIVRQVAEIADLKDTHIIGGSAQQAPGMLEAAGDAAKGLRLTNLDISTDVLGKRYPEFVEKYKAKFGEAPIQSFHAQAYDAMALLAAAIDKVAVEDGGNLYIGRKALRDAAFATKGMDGLGGPVNCNEHGSCGAFNFAVYQFTNGDPASFKSGENPMKVYPK